jgi:hypothetical protein
MRSSWKIFIIILLLAGPLLVHVASADATLTETWLRGPEMSISYSCSGCDYIGKSLWTKVDSGLSSYPITPNPNHPQGFKYVQYLYVESLSKTRRCPYDNCNKMAGRGIQCSPCDSGDINLQDSKSNYKSYAKLESVYPSTMSVDPLTDNQQSGAAPSDLSRPDLNNMYSQVLTLSNMLLSEFASGTVWAVPIKATRYAAWLIGWVSHADHSPAEKFKLEWDHPPCVNASHFVTISTLTSPDLNQAYNGAPRSGFTYSDGYDIESYCGTGCTYTKHIESEQMFVRDKIPSGQNVDWSSSRYAFKKTVTAPQLQAILDDF